jgi:lysophospholipase L1-like esterase
LGAAVVCNIAAASDLRWIDTWAAVPDSAGPALKAQTIRQIVRTSIGGPRVRVHLSNLFGTEPVTIGPVHIAAHATGSAIQAGSDHAVTFGGNSTVTIPKGADALSDPVSFPVTPLEELAVSMYLPMSTGASTTHGDAMQTAYITLRGDATGAAMLPTGEITSSRFFLTDVEVAADTAARAIVTVGDSITDGSHSTQDHFARWPDALAARLQADQALGSIAVLNAGISGSRLLHDGVGPSAQSRFDRDVLSKAGVRWIILLDGINDIGAANAPATPQDDVTAQQIIDGMKALIVRAHKKGIKIWGATLLPFGGTEWPFHSASGEEKRQSINAWIRTGGAFDAVLDFEQVVRDPVHPNRIAPSIDSGDHLHPNDAGYKAIAASIDLHLLTQER